MRHHLLTRCSYSPDDWTESELVERLRYFALVTMPSVAAQTLPPDEWVLGVHPRDPFLSARVIIAKRSGVPIRLVEMVDVGGRHWPKREPALSSWEIEPERRIETRLDDDDAITEDHILRINQAGRWRKVNTAIILPVGYHYKEGKFYADRYDHGMFASLLTTDETSIYDWTHNHVARHVEVIHPDEKPAWLRIIHGTNAGSMRFRKELEVVSEDITHLFPIDWSLCPT